MTVDELRTGLRDPATRQEVIDQLSDLGVRYAQLLERVPTNAGGQPRLLPPPLRLKLRQIQQDVDQSGLTDEEKGKLFREDIRQFLEEKIEPTDTF